MYSNEFEKCFADFLDRHEYDDAENALFAMVRIAFSAGWQAAGGAPPSPIASMNCSPPPPMIPNRKIPEKSTVLLLTFFAIAYIFVSSIGRTQPPVWVRLLLPFEKWGRIHVQGTDPPVGLLHEI